MRSVTGARNNKERENIAIVVKAFLSQFIVNQLKGVKMFHYAIDIG